MRSKITLLLFCILLPISLKAAEEKEETKNSYIAGTAQLGNQSYKSYDLASKIALGEIFRISGDYSNNQSANTPATRSLELGLDAQVLKSLDLIANFISTKNPNNISSTGFAPGISWEASSAWEGEKTTTISANFEFMKYKQSATPLATKRLGSKFSQNGLSVGLDQEISDTWGAEGSYSTYSYKNLAAGNGALLGKNASRARAVMKARASSTFDGLLNGLPKSSYTLGVHNKFLENCSAEAKYSHGKVMQTNARSDAPELGISYDINKAWTIAATTTREKQEYEAAVWIAGLTGTYNF